MEHIDVKFTGELSRTSKLFLKYKERKRLHRYCFRLLFFAFLFLVIMMIMGFIPQVNDNKGIMLTPAMIALVIALYSIVVVVCSELPKNMSYPLEVHFVENKVEVSMKPSFLYKKSHTKFEFSLEQIKEVHDYGEFYYIISVKGDVLCQKSLVSEHQLSQICELFETLNITVAKRKQPEVYI